MLVRVTVCFAFSVLLVYVHLSGSNTIVKVMPPAVAKAVLGAVTRAVCNTHHTTPHLTIGTPAVHEKLNERSSPQDLPTATYSRPCPNYLCAPTTMGGRTEVRGSEREGGLQKGRDGTELNGQERTTRGLG